MLFATVFMLFSAFSWEHPLKMSFSSLTIDGEGVVAMETRIFLDDVTEHMQQKYGLEQADFSSMTSNGTEALKSYIVDHLYFKQGDQKVALLIDSVTFSKHRLALVVKTSTAQPLNISKEFILVNTVMCDADPTQINDVRYLGKHRQFSYNTPEIKLVPLNMF